MNIKQCWKEFVFKLLDPKWIVIHDGIEEELVLQVRLGIKIGLYKSKAILVDGEFEERTPSREEGYNLVLHKEEDFDEFIRHLWMT